MAGGPGPAPWRPWVCLVGHMELVFGEVCLLLVLVCPLGSGEGAESKVWKEVFREIDLGAVNRGVGEWETGRNIPETGRGADYSLPGSSGLAHMVPWGSSFQNADLHPLGRVGGKPQSLKKCEESVEIFGSENKHR